MPPPPRTIPRRHDLDALRAVAMLLGIALHAALSLVEFPWVVQDSRQHDGFGLLFFAVHGFRMPVFFLMSGFFTAMLWRKRGLKSLLSHRFRRVFLPLLLGALTIVPAMNWISGRAAESAAAQATSGDLWTAARAGNLDAIEQQLAGGADIDAGDAAFGVTPLTWAVLAGHGEAADLLIQKGADVQARNRDGGTPLHAAAFLGRTGIADLLIENGADPLARNNNGETPLDSAAVDWGVTQFLAGLLRIEMDEAKVRGGRLKVAETLRGHGADGARPLTTQASREADQDGDNRGKGLAGLALLLMYFPLFHHLWFLWFLCWLVAAFAVYARVADRLRWQGPPQWLVLSPLRYLWLLPLTMVPQWFMGRGYPMFGPDTSTGILPAPHLLAYYAVFFFFGALYFDCDDDRGQVGRWWRLTLPLGLFIVFPLGLGFSLGDPGLRGLVADSRLHRPIAAAFQVVYAWMMTFGLMGMFRALLQRESKALRYVSDSSYWLYLAHLPLIIAAQMIVRDWPLPAGVKFVLVCGVVSALLLFTYETLVRYTWVGALLNGPRRRPSKAEARAA